VDWSKDLAKIEFPHYKKLRYAARLLLIRGVIQASQGQADDALASCSTALRIAKHAGTDPGILSQLVSYALMGMTAHSLELILSEGNPSQEACNKLIAQLAQFNQQKSLLKGLRSEAVIFSTSGFESVQKGANEAAPWSWPMIRAGININRYYYNQDMQKMIMAVQLPWPESSQATDEVERASESRPIFFSIGSTIFLPIVGGIQESSLRYGALVGAARIALALETYRQKHDKLPDDLAMLKAIGFTPPNDPFTHKPYHYRFTNPGFLVWSLGPDMNDDNGKPQYTKRKKPPSEHLTREEQWDYDVPFRCTR
jgi:hypothetical protein